MSRIRIETTKTATSPHVLIVSDGFEKLVQQLTRRLMLKHCRVSTASSATVPLVPFDYLIVINSGVLPANVVTILNRQRSRTRLLYIEIGKETGSQESIVRLKTMNTMGDIRTMHITDQGADPDTIFDALFRSRDKSSKLKLPLRKKFTLPSPIGKISSPPSMMDVYPQSVEKHTTWSFSPYALRYVVLLLLIVLLISPLFFVLYHLYIGVKGLQTIAHTQSLSQIRMQTVDDTEKHFKEAGRILDGGRILVGPLASLPGFETLERMADSGRHSTTIVRHGLVLFKLAKDASASLFTRDPQPISVILPLMGQEVTSIGYELDGLEKQLSGLESSRLLSLPLLSPMKKKLTKGQTTIEQAKELVHLGQTILPLIPDLLGVNGKKAYLFLFQNNTELRPGGGFIGSYGVAQFEGGKMTSFTVEDIYTADGQLKGHVDPPLPIRKYLEQPHWYMRDSNIDPDFPTNATQAEWFLEKEMGITVDGTIALDLTFTKYLVDALGGLTLPDYNERITADNMFLKAQAFVQRDFFPGSTRKRDFLGSLSRAMLLTLTTSENLPWLSLARAMKTALDEKHMMIFLHDTEAMKVIDLAGWSGRLAAVSCIGNDSACLPDYVSLSEVNVGVNKANAFLRRTIKQSLRVQPDRIERHMQVLYINDSPPQAFPSGDYKSYIRILLPYDAVDVRLFQADQPIASSDLQVERYQDKKLLGFFLHLPALARQTVEVQYSLSLPKGKPTLLYQLTVQKQPGTENDALELSLDPLTAKIVHANFPLVLGQPARYNTFLYQYSSDLSVDRLYRLTIER